MRERFSEREFAAVVGDQQANPTGCGGFGDDADQAAGLFAESVNEGIFNQVAQDLVERAGVAVELDTGRYVCCDLIAARNHRLQCGEYLDELFEIELALGELVWSTPPA